MHDSYSWSPQLVVYLKVYTIYVCIIDSRERLGIACIRAAENVDCEETCHSCSFGNFGQMTLGCLTNDPGMFFFSS